MYMPLYLFDHSIGIGSDYYHVRLIFRAVFVDFLTFLNLFEGGSLSQPKPSSTEGLSFAVLDVHSNGEAGRHVLLLCSSKFELLMYSYNQY